MEDWLLVTLACIYSKDPNTGNIQILNTQILEASKYQIFLLATKLVNIYNRHIWEMVKVVW